MGVIIQKSKLAFHNARLPFHFAPPHRQTVVCCSTFPATDVVTFAVGAHSKSQGPASKTCWLAENVDGLLADEYSNYFRITSEKPGCSSVLLLYCIASAVGRSYGPAVLFFCNKREIQTTRGWDDGHQATRGFCLRTYILAPCGCTNTIRAYKLLVRVLLHVCNL